MQKVFLVLLLCLLVVGCGPKWAKKETMDALNEARAALQGAEAKVGTLENEKAQLIAQKSALEQDIANLSAEIDALQTKIDTRCKRK